ncbi:MAG: hypothetical protein ACI4SR_07535 [Faecalibacillus sp.]
MKKRQFNKWGILGIVVFLIISVCTIYIIINHIGQVEGVLCGPGQYYYTDIPNWKDYFLKNYYTSKTPTYILIILFFVWGFIMYKVWCWLDKKIK